MNKIMIAMILGTVGLMAQFTPVPLGTVTMPTPVFETKARRAFQKQVVFDLSKGGRTFTSSLQIPAGKVLVIEHVTAQAWQESNDYRDNFPTMFTLTLTSRVDNEVVAHYVPFTGRGIVNYQNLGYLACEKTQLYHDGGSTPLVVTLSRVYHPFPGNATISISGYLVDAN